MNLRVEQYLESFRRGRSRTDLRRLAQLGVRRSPPDEIQRYRVDRRDEPAHLMPGSTLIETPDELADRGFAALGVRQLGGLQQVVQADHAVRYQELRQEAFRVLSLLTTGYRAEDHRDDDRDILPRVPVTILTLHVSVNPSRMNRPTQATRNRVAFDVELMNKIG